MNAEIIEELSKEFENIDKSNLGIINVNNLSKIISNLD
jgi:Ca2+-binding EF-hand superfamily protein